MKQMLFLVAVQVNKDGSNPTSATDIGDLLKNKGLQVVEVSDCADYSEVELRSFSKVSDIYSTQTKTTLTQDPSGSWSKLESTSSVLYAKGK